MRDDHLTDAGSMELAWMREDGCGPDIVNVKAVVFLYDQPGPKAHVGLHVEGRGGPSLPVDTTRALAALLLKAAGIAERDGAAAPVATPDELATYDWFCSYCGEKVDEQTRDEHVRSCSKHPMAQLADKLAASEAQAAELTEQSEVARVVFAEMQTSVDKAVTRVAESAAAAGQMRYALEQADDALDGEGPHAAAAQAVERALATDAGRGWVSPERHERAEAMQTKLWRMSAMLASALKSGEPWTDTLQSEWDALKQEARDA